MGQLSAVRAAITTWGDISPATNPATWTSSTSPHIGNTSGGTLTVNGNSQLLSQVGYLGYNTGATGIVTVAGIGATWTSGGLDIGEFGNGTLTIANGGAVSGTCKIGINTGATGAMIVDGIGSTSTNRQMLVGGQGGGTGTLKITGGGFVHVSNGLLGIAYGSGTGLVTVDGAGSTCSINVASGEGEMAIGLNNGNGTLKITNGGTVANTGICMVGWGGTGSVTVERRQLKVDERRLRLRRRRRHRNSENR